MLSGQSKALSLMPTKDNNHKVNNHNNDYHLHPNPNQYHYHTVQTLMGYPKKT